MGLPNYITKIDTYGTGTTVRAYKTNAEVETSITSIDILSMGTIPGLERTFSFDVAKNTYILFSSYVPQGICIAGNYILITAYDFNENGRSVIYVVRSSDKVYITTLILPFTTHVGGIAYDTSNKYIWVANNKSIAGFPYTDLQSIIQEYENDREKKYGAYRFSSMPRNFSVMNQASCLTFFDNLLWVGTFNESSTSSIYGYIVNISKATISAKYYIEAPKHMQGLSFYKKDSVVYLAISKSYGIEWSEVRLYKPSYSNPQNVSGKTYKKILKNNAYKVRIFPHGAEEICVNGGSIYLIFESEAEPYRDKWTNCIDKYVLFKTNSFFEI